MYENQLRIYIFFNFEFRRKKFIQKWKMKDYFIWNGTIKKKLINDDVF